MTGDRIHQHTLRRRILLGLLGYTLLLSAIILTFGQITNANEEFAIQHSLLSAELDDFVRDRIADPAYPPPQSRTLHTYVRRNENDRTGIPAELLALAPGLHDETGIGDRSVTAFVRDVGSQRIYMTIDVTEQEAQEKRIFEWSIPPFLLCIGGLALVIWWLSGQLLRPVSDLAAMIARVAPDKRGQRIDIAANDVHEIASIANAMNGYLERMDAFVSRETAFIDNISHELRTPIAVISGAAEVIGLDTTLSSASRAPLARIRQTTADVEQLIRMLLVLAKDPERLRAGGATCSLEKLVPDIVSAHQHLRGDKTLQISVGELVPSRIAVSAQTAQVVIANILRNAIENTDCGRVEVSVNPA
ncbi:MAG TPA: HAMP domain-containing sensor histidine kinase, partial [Xanthomonadaceae bacterium]|nr:HAMP domain-containing sensor histidine kinase [Xanthomonadaceae bacterium]